MAEKREISSAIIVSEGIDIKDGMLSLLQKSNDKLFKVGKSYGLCPLYWRLLSYAGELYMLGFPRKQAGQKATKKYVVHGCSTELALPAKFAVASRHSNEKYLCIQHGESLTFLHADDRSQRDAWVQVIHQRLSRFGDASSSDTIERLDPRSVRGTADTKARTRGDPRRIKSAAVGKFVPSHAQEHNDLIPSSASALAKQNRHSSGITYSATSPSLLSSPYTLRSSEISRPRSLCGIYSDESDTCYSGFDDCYLNPNDPSPLHRQSSRSDPELNLHALAGKRESVHNTENSYEEVGSLDDPPYLELVNNDDDTITLDSVVHNLPVNKGIKDVPPPVPTRDYCENHPHNVSSKRPSQKKRAPLPPVANSAPKPSPTPPANENVTSQRASVDSIDSIAREKTVMLERKDQLQQTPVNQRARVTNSLSQYVLSFRGEHFESDGIQVAVPKEVLSTTTIKLVCVGDQICVAAMYDVTLHNRLHVGDVILKVNAQNLPSVSFCYELFKTTDDNEVHLLIKRVVHGCISHVTLSANGDVSSLGLEFKNRSHGIEITKILGSGLVAQSGHPSRQNTAGIINGGSPVNWGLVEVNQSPVPLNASPEQVMEQIRSSGCELALVFLPMDIVQELKGPRCDDAEEDIYEIHGESPSSCK